MPNNEYTSKFNIDITDLKRGMQQANQLMKVANSEFKAATGGMDKWGSSADGLSAKLKQLTSIHDAQRAKLELLEAEYSRVVAAEGESSKGAQDLYIKINNLKGEIGKTESEIQKYSSRLDDLQAAEKAAADEAQKSESAYDGLKNTIAEQESQLQSLKKEYANVALEQGNASAEATSLAGDIQRLSGELKENKSKLAEAESAANSFDDSLDDVADSAEDTSGGFTIMKGALADLVANGIRSAIDAFKELLTASSEANANFRAQTGSSTAQMDKFSESIKRVYQQNFGESLQDVADAMAQVKQQTGELDPSKLEAMTKNGITLRDTFGYDMGEQMRAVNMLMKQFGLTGEEAFNFIVAGAQNGLDKNGDLLDTINEYSVHYAQQGYSADQFYNSLKNGASAGTFSIDKLGDAMKEFGIRSKDTAATTTEGFELIGLDADAMREKFAAGGDSAQEATKQTLEALLDMDDQVKQNQAGVDLFGTMWEDLGIEGVKALMDVSGEAVTTKKSMKELSEVKYSDIGSQIGEIGRLFKTELLQPIVDLVQPAVEKLASFLIDNFDTAGPVIMGVAAAFGTLGAALAIQGIINGVTKAFSLLNLTMLANPYVLIAAAIVGLVVAFVALWNKSEEFRNFWIGLWEGIKRITASVVSAIVNFFTVTLPEGFNTAITAVGNFVSGVVSWFKQLPGKVASFLSSVISHVASWAAEMPARARDAGSRFLSAVISFVSQLPGKIWGFLSDAAGKVASWAVDLASKGAKAAKSLFDSVVDGVKEIPKEMLSIGKNIVSGLWDGISGAVGGFMKNVKSFAGGIVDGIMGALGINSPSTVMRDMVGRFIPAGIAEGIKKNAKVALAAMNELAADLVPSAEGIKVSAANSVSGASGSAQVSGGGGITQNFYQYNNSPKSLSRLEIYRQTKNQLNFAKGVS